MSTYRATSGDYSSVGSSPAEAKLALAEVIRSASDEWRMGDHDYRPLPAGKKLDAARRREAMRLTKRAVVSITTEDLSGWDDDGYFSGFGRRRLTSTTWRGWHIERHTDAEGRTTITACRSSAMTRAAQRSIRAGGGVRGLCTDHVPSGKTIVLSERDNLLDVLGGAR